MKTSTQKQYENFHTRKVPAALQDQWARAEDEGRDNASTTDIDGKLLGYVPHDVAFQSAFVDTIAFVSVCSEGYTEAFRVWLAKCGIVG